MIETIVGGLLGYLFAACLCGFLLDLAGLIQDWQKGKAKKK
jgi:hypothetical protein